jgi:hypothetical protein
MRLCQRLQEARAGDWCALEIDDHLHLWTIQETKPFLMLEEQIVPVDLAAALGSQPSDWPRWLQSVSSRSGPAQRFRWSQDSSWESFSTVHHRWEPMESARSLLSFLFCTQLQSVPESRQRRVGPRPRGPLDDRAVWKPPLARSLNQVEVWATRVETPSADSNSFLLTIWMAPPGTAEIPSEFPLHAEAERAGVKLRCRTRALGRALSTVIDNRAP